LALRAAIRGQQAADGVADVAKNIEMVEEAIGGGFQGGAPDMGDGVVEAEAGDGAAGGGVVNRAFFAEEVGEENTPSLPAWMVAARASSLAWGFSPRCGAKLAATQLSMAPVAAMQPFGMKAPGMT